MISTMEHSTYAELWASGIAEEELADAENLRRMREYQFWAVSGPHEDILFQEPVTPPPLRQVRHSVIRGLPWEWEDDVYGSEDC